MIAHLLSRQIMQKILTAHVAFYGNALYNSRI